MVASSLQFSRRDLDGFSQRASLKGEGLTEESYHGRAVIGICNTWSDYVHCNKHFRELTEHVRRGILQEGGLPMEFSVLSLGEPFMKPTTMMFRNLMAMDVEEGIRAYPMDAVVLLGGCDKTIPALLMGAISAGVPAVLLPGGPQIGGQWRGRQVGACTDCWRLGEQVRSGERSEDDLADLEDSIVRSAGHCPTMGTASTMACLAEALGMTLPGAAAIPAVDSRRAQIADRTGRLAVQLAVSGPTPKEIVTAAAVRNAIVVLQAIAGSTNGVIHLAAIAGRAGIPLAPEEFNVLGSRTPWLVNVKPSGEFLMEDFYFAGGVPALMRELVDLLDTSVRTVSAAKLGDQIPEAGSANEHVLRSRSTHPQPQPWGAIATLSGSLCPRGAVIKVTAASQDLLVHEGRAIVFDGLDDLAARIDDPDLAVDATTVFILRGVGPIGAPGMPECGHLPIPKKLLADGVDDVVRISDARMSGTAYGTCVLHVAPESAIGGPLALVVDGDVVRLDVPARRLDLIVDSAELERRAAAWRPAPAPARRGYEQLYVEHTQQADVGCDFDFLLPTQSAEEH